ncbi:MAG TPA: FmdB family zinc ribbon protein [Candidatus Saccharimonadales bacterium]|nr:FmdB family zinc ribbon protein [Candidatus Saccharimonadales bacterium]
MPTYEYECRACGHRFEEYQSIKAKPLRTCPRCKGRVRRLVSGGSGLLFKGSGFYITDYRSQSYREKARDERGGAAGGKSEPAKGRGKGKGGESGGSAAGAGCGG